MVLELWMVYTIIGVGSALVAAVTTYLVLSPRLAQSQRTAATLELQLSVERERAAQRQLDEKTVADRFAALSSQALRVNNESFLQLAKENLHKLQLQAQQDLGQRQKAIEHVITPIREALNKTEHQLQLLDRDRRESFGALQAHLQSMAETQTQLQSETQNLVQALRRPEVRGQWGELTLQRLVELAGMVEYCDFYRQESQHSDMGTQRPDLVVRMPESREIIVDAKTPLDAYLSAMESSEPNERKNFLQNHARNIQRSVRRLSSKTYWAQFKDSPEFVVLFIPGEQFLAAAIDYLPKLQEDALSHKIILATPNNFIALLKTIAFGWRQHQVTENAGQIREAGEELYQRLATFIEHLDRAGNQLGASVESYNKAIGSLERQLMPQARKFKELGIRAKKEIPVLEPLEQSPRQPS